jgi:myo-inositol-1(or 4)-monophosphatase
MHPMLNTAIKAARRGGAVIMRHLNHLESLTVETKGRADYVSEVDRMAEADILQVLRQAYPDMAVLAEETGETPGNDFCWIVDPLDGTTNFLHGYPQFAVSIGLRHKDRLEQAVVFDPRANELFTASRGQGAFMNDRRLRVSKTSQLEHALVGTGFPYRRNADLDTWMAILTSMIKETSGVRRAGSAALDLAYVAAGRFDGFWEFGLKAWDTAAGALLVQEAGGLVSDIRGGSGYLASGNILAGNPKLHPELLSRIAAHLPADVTA